MTCDIMIVTYNRVELTKKTIECLFKNTHYPYNLIFVDNGSSDNTVSYLEKTCKDNVSKVESFKNYTIKKNKRNLGIARGRNQCLKLSTSKWLTTFDNDVLVPDGWLTKCIDVLTANASYGAIGVNMENKDYPLVKKGGFEFQYKTNGTLGTACMVFNRKLHKMLGFFSEDYKDYAHEDADFGVRIRLLGLKLGYIKEKGTHIGEGKYDKGEYRKFKDLAYEKNLSTFYTNCRAYMIKQKHLYIPFKNE